MTRDAWVTCGILLLMPRSLARGVAGADIILTSAAVLLLSLRLTSTRFPAVKDLQWFSTVSANGPAGSSRTGPSNGIHDS